MCVSERGERGLSRDDARSARIKLERIDEPGEWSANGHVIRQRCYTVSLSYE